MLTKTRIVFFFLAIFNIHSQITKIKIYCNQPMLLIAIESNKRNSLSMSQTSGMIKNERGGIRNYYNKEKFKLEIRVN